MIAVNSFLELLGREVPPIWRQLGRFTALQDLGVVDVDRTTEAMTKWLASGNIVVKGRSWLLSSAEAWTRSQY